jgi:hypothetical protein
MTGDAIVVGLAVLEIGLAAVLAGIAHQSARRYRELRFDLVAAAVALLGVIGLGALVAELGPSGPTALRIGAVPLAVAVGALMLLLASLTLRRAGPARDPPM